MRYGTKILTNNCWILDISYVVKEITIKDNMPKSGTLSWNKSYLGESHKTSSIGFILQPENSDLFFRVFYVDTVSKEKFDYKIPLTYTIPNYGGKRWWFLCPVQGCYSRAGKLYLTSSNIFSCRKCLNLAYPSSNETERSRLLSKAQNIHLKLGGSGCLADDIDKPKNMHWQTFNNLIDKMDILDDMYMDALRRRFFRFP